eukprot:gnl/TRDRNA2_/TRDRNA2_159754_c2_seq3.p1 gnl/TRDRNA2_/TRDRNA2_159754_c2~~gnl/TRDRNA2_/TRDRNA2_159754_c2_seq3.p1  ORF type:complete len:309 (+),score=41.20 gnl/TRDRNA2_/TRDRNA2_159754_c2_seq3:54-980(+)
MPLHASDEESEKLGSSEHVVTLKEALEVHAHTVQSVLRCAASAGRVAILTLAEESWYWKSLDFIPGTAEVIEELKIKVVMARDTAVPQDVLNASAIDGQLSLPLALKQAAIVNTISQFYSLKGGVERSWKNVISVGDSEIELLASFNAVATHTQLDSSGRQKPCRSKRVKLLEAPQLQDLTLQLKALLSWFPTMAQYDGDFLLDLTDCVFDEAQETSWGRPRVMSDESGNDDSFSVSIEVSEPPTPDSPVLYLKGGRCRRSHFTSSSDATKYQPAPTDDESVPAQEPFGLFTIFSRAATPCEDDSPSP